MDVIASQGAFLLEAEQTGRGANYARYKIRCTNQPVNGGSYYWGNLNAAYLVDHNGNKVSLYWNAPNLEEWRKGGWKINGAALAYDARQNTGGAYSVSDSITSNDIRVDIDRGTARQGSKTVTAGLYTTMNGNLSSIYGNIKLYTAQIADPSSVEISLKVDGKDVTDRKIHLEASFTNPENYYTADIYFNGTYKGSSRGGYNLDIPVTKDLFNKTVSATIKIVGNDGIEYTSSTSDAVKVEPSGVGVWYKNSSGKIKEITNVYYKDRNGVIKEVTEIWVRKNSKNLKTVK